MLSIFLGGDTARRRQEIRKKIATEIKENNFKESFIFNDANFSIETISNLLGSGGLFSAKNIIVFDRILDNEEVHDYLFSKISEMNDSESIFIINEKELKADFLKKIEKEKIKILSFDEKEKTSKKFFGNSGFDL